MGAQARVPPGERDEISREVTAVGAAEEAAESLLRPPGRCQALAALGLHEGAEDDAYGHESN